MVYKMSAAGLERLRAERDRLVGSEREQLAAALQEAQAGAAAFSPDVLMARNALYQLEAQIGRLDQILENGQVLREEDPEDALALSLARIKYENAGEEEAVWTFGNTRFSLSLRREDGQSLARLCCQKEGEQPFSVCLLTDAAGKQDFYILAEPFSGRTDLPARAAVHYPSLAQASGSAYLPCLLIVYYLVRDSETASGGVPDDDYYLDDTLCRFLADCPPWLPLPEKPEGLTADAPGKTPVCSAQVPRAEDHVILRVEYGDLFGLEYQILPEEAEEEDGEEDLLEEYYHLRDLLYSRYLRYYLMLLAQIEPAEKPFTRL